jgi:hypothetical protein
MLTTAGEVALITGARDGSTTPAEAAAPRWGMKADNMNAMKSTLTSAQVFTNWVLRQEGDILKVLVVDAE